MKKKFKLIATIGSLALAICMLTIGVLAAASATLDVKSQVTFEAQNVNATYEIVKVEPTATWAVPADTAFTSLAAIPTESQTVTFEGKLTETNKVAGYAVKIKNNYTANQTINVAFTPTTTPADAKGYTIESDCATTIAAGEFIIAYIYVTVDPATIIDGTVITLDTNFVLTLAAVQA